MNLNWNITDEDLRRAVHLEHQFGDQLAERAGGTFRLDLHDVLANDEHVVALTNATAQREGKTLNDNGAQVFHVTDGKVSEQWFHPGDQYASDEFWS